MNKQKDLGSLLASTFFVLLGVIIIYDTTSYSDFDSKVFPRACAVVLIVFSILAIARDFFKQTSSEGFGRGSWWRRILLVVTMLIACFVMPYVSFLPAGAIAFVGGLIAAMHDQWSKRTLALYWGSGLIIIIAFYVIFRHVLHVPLP
jgi:putative tricarboxylic transport membrane protein